MDDGEQTCWTMIRGAAAGDPAERSVFVRRYSPVLRAYLRARWRGTPLIQEVDDAIQEVFLDCFRSNGVLSRADSERPGGFRAFFYGVIRNTALMAERRLYGRKDRPASESLDLDDLADEEESLGAVFDRAFAGSVLSQAGELQQKRAAQNGDAARRRVELLRLRFQEGVPIREIARLWDEEPARLHHEYATARQEFRDALLTVVAFHHPGDPGEVERECARLINLFD